MTAADQHLLSLMIQELAYDPASGAPLSSEKSYPRAYSQGVRTPVEHPLAAWDSSREGALTNGELVSSTQGLLGYFRRVHRDVREPDPQLDSSAALAIKRLKSTDDGRGTLDCLIWYALAERLARKGHWVAWMFDHTIPRCPTCSSRLKFRPGVGGLEGVCGSAPMRHGAVDEDIRECVRETYESAFCEDRDGIDDLRLL